MAVTDIKQFAHLTDADVEAIGRELDQIRRDIEESRGDLLGALVVVDRTGGLTHVTSPRSGKSYDAQALWSLNLPTYEQGPATCPGCKQGLTLEAPGTSGTKPGATG